MEGTSRASRGVAYAALAAVSLIAAVVSYLHALAVVQAVGARPPVAYLVPFLADLVILGASAALLDAARRGQRPPALAAGSLTVGVGVTLAMNVAAGWQHGTAGALVAGWPAVAFILALESFAGMVRRGRGTLSPPGSPAVPDHCPHQVPAAAPAGERAVAAWLHIRDCEGRQPRFREVGRQVGIHHGTVAQMVRSSMNGDGQ